MSNRLLVVAAIASEAAYVPSGLTCEVIGLGKTAAAAATTRALLEHRPDLVVNIGTAGALRDGLAGLHLPSRVLNHDLSADVIRQLGVDPQEWLDLDGGDGSVLATGDQFVTDHQVRARLGQLAHMVDMEGYAVVWACQQLGVPVQVVKHISDNADAAAMDWPQLVDRSAQALGEWLQVSL